MTVAAAAAVDVGDLGESRRRLRAASHAPYRCERPSTPAACSGKANAGQRRARPQRAVAPAHQHGDDRLACCRPPPPRWRRPARSTASASGGACTIMTRVDVVVGERGAHGRAVVVRASTASRGGPGRRPPSSPAVVERGPAQRLGAAGVGEHGDAWPAHHRLGGQHPGRVEHRGHGRHLDQPGLLVQRAAGRPDRRGARCARRRSGGCRDTRRAMRANLRGLPNDSVYMAMTRVVSSSSQNCSRSLPDTSHLSPSDTNHDRPDAQLVGEAQHGRAERAGLQRDRHVARRQVDRARASACRPIDPRAAATPMLPGPIRRTP